VSEGRNHFRGNDSHQIGVQIHNLIARKNNWFLESLQPTVQTFF
jgi:hypothetical protein